MTSALPRRRSVRLPYYDYASYGWYFVTICAKDFKHLFGGISAGSFHPSGLGELLEAELMRSADLRSELRLDCYVIMPNHAHLVVVIDREKPVDQLRNETDDSGRLVLKKAGLGGQARSLSSFVGGMKSAVTSNGRKLLNLPDLAVWNRGFHEHVVRSEVSLEAIRIYVTKNPQQWELDRYNQDRRLPSLDDELDKVLAEAAQGRK